MVRFCCRCRGIASIAGHDLSRVITPLAKSTQGWASQARHGGARLGMARRVKAIHRRFGQERHGVDRRGPAGRFIAGSDRSGGAGRGQVRQGLEFIAGWVRRGEAW
jgi:hypothetical protein